MYFLLIVMLVSATGDIIWVEPKTHFPSEVICLGQFIDHAALFAMARKQWGYGPVEVRRICAPVPPALVQAGPNAE